MEFSFDPAREKQREAKAETQQSENQASAAGPRPGPDLNSVDPSTIANERLRKAIERNRAKQAERDSQSPPRQSFTPPPRPPVQDRQEAHEQKSFIQEESLPPRPTTVVRRSVAKPEDTEFVPVKRTTRKVASQINYTSSTSGGTTKRKARSLDPKYSNYLVKGCWIFCGLMILRLIFASGGVTDYYAQKASLSERTNELFSIKNENMQLVQEIERMRSDSGYQKKLVRDNLGFIASDEFLVLFPKEK